MKNILVVSNEPWGDVWFSKQHYAYELAKLGHQVFFINPTKKWQWTNVFSISLKKEKINKNLTVLIYQNNFPQGRFPKFFTKVNDYLNCLKIKSAIDLKEEIIWWKFDPYRFLNTYPLNKAKQIYHVVDSYMHLWQDEIHSQNSDLIICTSPKYMSFYDRVGIKEVIKIPHGISTDEFELDMTEVGKIKGMYGEFALLIGSIVNDIDISILRKIANQKINIVIVGQDLLVSEEWEALKKDDFVFFLGKKHAKELKNYVAASKIGLIVYNFISNKKDQVSRSPLKALNYLTQKIPIISSIDTEINELENKGIYKAVNAKNYVLLVKQAMNSDLYVNAEKISVYLKEHEYSLLINNILNRLSK